MLKAKFGSHAATFVRPFCQGIPQILARLNCTSVQRIWSCVSWQPTRGPTSFQWVTIVSYWYEAKQAWSLYWYYFRIRGSMWRFVTSSLCCNRFLFWKCIPLSYWSFTHHKRASGQNFVLLWGVCANWCLCQVITRNLSMRDRGCFNPGWITFSPALNEKDRRGSVFVSIKLLAKAAREKRKLPSVSASRFPSVCAACFVVWWGFAV